MRTHKYFDKFARHNKMRPVKRVETDYGSILLADSGDIITENKRMFYRTGFAILREGEGLDLGSFAEYELNEPGGSHDQQKYRLTDAEMAAKQLMAQLDDTGYYDADQKYDFGSRTIN